MLTRESKLELSRSGDCIPADKFFVSKMNVRVEEAFGDTDEDQALLKHLQWRDIVQPFIARPEGNRYGVVIGRRRFLAKKKSGVKEFDVGKDCWIREMIDEEALDASLRENLALFRAELNPIARAKALANLIGAKLIGLRGLARLWRLPVSTLSEWLKILELSPRMQAVTANGLLYYTDALKVARMELGTELQDKLAEFLEIDGYDAFRNELARLQTGKGKRGIPKGKYWIDRIVWDKRNLKEQKYYEILAKVVEAKETTVSEYIKNFIIAHIEEIAGTSSYEPL
jgi:ParB-like chromosome segregation protein Spo0J